MDNLPKIISYDLTTPDGMAFAITDYAKQNPMKAAAAMAMFAIGGPVALLSAALGNTVFKSASALFQHPEKMIKAQRKAAIDIIKAGKENGAAKINMKLNQKAGIDIGGELEGYSMKFSVGTDDQMTIEVEYK